MLCESGWVCETQVGEKHYVSLGKDGGEMKSESEWQSKTCLVTFFSFTVFGGNRFHLNTTFWR